MNFTIKFTLMVAMISLCVREASSQSEEPTRKKLSNSLRDSVYALQFQIDQNFSISSFQGGIISVKKHLADNAAVRIGVSLTASSAQSDESVKNSPADTIRGSTSSNPRGFSVGVTAQYVYYADTPAPINLYFGGGPLLNYSRFARNDEQNDFSGSNFNRRKYGSEENRWSLGAGGQLGVEWFATEYISLLGEYGISLTYSWSKYVNSTTYSNNGGEYTQERDTQANIFQFNPVSVKLGLSVYF